MMPFHLPPQQEQTSGLGHKSRNWHSPRRHDPTRLSTAPPEQGGPTEQPTPCNYCVTSPTASTRKRKPPSSKSHTKEGSYVARTCVCSGHQSATSKSNRVMTEALHATLAEVGPSRRHAPVTGPRCSAEPPRTNVDTTNSGRDAATLPFVSPVAGCALARLPCGTLFSSRPLPAMRVVANTIVSKERLRSAVTSRRNPTRGRGRPARPALRRSVVGHKSDAGG